ncbi:hypothetical protein DFH07DRAFT_1057502 [Mycena maculata]|uniref:MYND-type domain-containing protein n=1 Tax=Mycena maculata TaxID=230809 RepID=A0AAD7NS10_9AGAR|nr:hypothetical protein DFH07DRAFT_1057502 [Mycena maculata]
MPRIPSAQAIALEVDRLSIHQRQKKLPSTFLTSFSVKQRLGDLSVDRLPTEPSIDEICTKPLTDAELTAVKLANDALLLFSRLTYLVDHNGPSLRSMMLHVWDAGVWKWMLFLYNFGVDLNDTIANQDRPLSITRQVITVGIVDALVGCAESVPLGKRLTLTPDILALIGRLWVEDLEIPGRPNMVHKELTFTMYHIMNDATDGSVLSTLVHAVDGGAMTIMQAATNRFRQLASCTPIDASSISSQASFIDSITKNPMLRDAMHEVETISVTLRAIDALTSQVRGPKAIEACIDLILIPHLLSGTSIKPLIQAINKGLLRSLYNARMAFLRDEDCGGAIEDIIIQVVGPSLAFRSVLHAVERSENKTSVFVRSLAAGTELHEWETLLDVYREMIELRRELDEEYKPCGRKTCSTRDSDLNVKMHRCAKCQYRRYCSRDCQQQDWPEHKHHCRKESDREIYPVSDREFARVAAEFEVTKNLESLCQRIQKNPVLKTSTEDLTFQVDFSTLDRNISIGISPVVSQGPERLAIIYAKVKSGREDLRSLGLVTPWDELRANLWAK